MEDQQGNHTMMDDMMMQMYFYATSNVTILFKEWMTMTWLELFGSCMFFVLLSFLHEGLRTLRYWIDARSEMDRRTKLKEATETSIALDNQRETASYGTTDNLLQLSSVRLYANKYHVQQTALHFLQIFNSYVLMLVVMTFNIWLVLSICIGATLGFYVFAGRQAHYRGYTNDCCY